MTLSDSIDARRLRVPAYLILGLAGSFPLADLTMGTLPPHFGVVAWRYGAVGLAASSMSGPLVALVLIYAVALAFGDRKVIGVVGTLAAIMAVTLFLAIGAFSLDTLQMKAQVRPEQTRRFFAGSGYALVKLLVQAVAALVLAVSAFRALRAARRTAVREGRRSDTLVVGAGGGKPPAAKPAAGSPPAGASPLGAAPRP